MRIVLLLGSLLAATGALAQAAPPPPPQSAPPPPQPRETIISDKDNAGWTFEGNPKLKDVTAADLPGGKAILVSIPAKGANPWDVQARLQMKQGISEGDIITFGFFARAEKPDPGRAGSLVQVRVQRNIAPYDAAVDGVIDVVPEWRFHCLVGPARIAIPASELMVSVQLAGERREIELGPYLATRIPANAAKTTTGLPCGQSIAAP